MNEMQIKKRENMKEALLKAAGEVCGWTRKSWKARERGSVMGK